MTSYSNDPRLTYRIKHIQTQHERKPVSSNVAGTKPHTTTTTKVEGTKGVETKVGDSTRSKPGGKPTSTTTSPKGSKRS